MLLHPNDGVFSSLSLRGGRASRWQSPLASVLQAASQAATRAAVRVCAS